MSERGFLNRRRLRYILDICDRILFVSCRDYTILGIYIEKPVIFLQILLDECYN